MKSRFVWGVFCGWMLGVVVFCSSCLKISLLKQEKIPLDNSKIEVYGFLTPADSIYIYVKIPEQSVVGKPTTVASVQLFDDRRHITLQKGSHSRVYKASQKDFAIEAGKTYRLRIESAGYPVVQAYTKLPAKKAVWKSLASHPVQDGYGLQIIGVWDQVADAYYGVLFNWIVNAEHLADNITNEGITDIGTSLRIKKEIYAFNPSQVTAILLTRDYNYQKYSEVYDLSSMVGKSLAEPDFSDIFSTFKGRIPSFSNIENGRGVLGSFLKDERNIVD